MSKKFPFYHQLDHNDCGPTCLRMIAKYYGKIYSLETLREKSLTSQNGSSLSGVCEAGEAIGLKTLSVNIPFEKLKREATLPVIAHWRQKHFIVIYDFRKDKVLVADPAFGLIRYSKNEFLDGWLNSDSNGTDNGSVLLLETTPQFHEKEGESKANKSNFGYLFKYLYSYKKFLVQVFLGMLIGSLLQLVFPFLTQSVVDIGINNQDVGFVNLILLAQLFLLIGRTSVEFIRRWILLHVGTRINISIISDFLIKLMKLPISFFDSRTVGDILQRIGDHGRINSFLTSSTLSIIFSIVNLLVFSLVLITYNLRIFSVFIIGSALYLTWIVIFLKKRKELDYKRFDQLSSHQSNLIQLVAGIKDIKLNNCERQKRWEWERIQARLFKVSVQNLSLTQYQEAGSLLINEFKNLLITFLAAKAVIDGDITLGMMLAIQYIIGQLNAPIGDLIGFVQSAQDAKISLERLGEIHNKKDEIGLTKKDGFSLNRNEPLYIKNLSFSYDAFKQESALENINIEIPGGKVTAIVGMSGSGKTTLLKLLLKFYEPSSGEIRLGNAKLSNVNSILWREKVGAVLQDSFIFSDTIAGNIALGSSNGSINREKLYYAVKTANIQDFIESLPMGFNTVIGDNGHGLSQGQKQRIQIARAIYKDPEFIFFDEATNSLDTKNENLILNNLNLFFLGKTVVVVAHRLSTVKNADQIVVLHKGNVVEVGNHKTLIEKKSAYFELVKNQLALIE